MLGWIGFIWLLIIDTLEQVVETSRERFLSHSSSAREYRCL